jgi:LysM repeat protein
VVQPGDTLSDLAVRFDVTVAALIEANRLANPRAIVSGHTLLIPTPATPTPPAPGSPAAAPPTAGTPPESAPGTTAAGSVDAGAPPPAGATDTSVVAPPTTSAG